MLLKIATAVVGLLAGGWMIVDGVHVLARGKYFGPDRFGPWSLPFIKLGINPFSLGPLFIALGVLWLVFLAGFLGGHAWGRVGAVIVAIATLWYVPLGTLLSLAYLCLLYVRRA
jgi:hypothetical protein